MVGSIHIPVLADEVLQQLNPLPGQTFVDGTTGGGGHTRLIAERVAPDGLVVAIDRDPKAAEATKRTLCDLPIRFFQANYCDLPEVLEAAEIAMVNGVLLDLGLSSDQLADSSRGFSFSTDGPLDLRFNPQLGEPAWRLIGRLSESDLADLIYQYGEERYSRRIARQIVASRRHRPIHTSAELASLVRNCVPQKTGRRRIDSATRTFQALRIAVNDELGSLKHGLERFPQCLKVDGKLAIISFHSLEDRIVKQAFRESLCFEPITKRPIRPTEYEIDRNPRSRSARLRVARRVCEREAG